MPDMPTTPKCESPDEWYERERAAFIAWWESEGQKKFGETPTLAAGAGWLARAEAMSSETGFCPVCKATPCLKTCTRTLDDAMEACNIIAPSPDKKGDALALCRQWIEEDEGRSLEDVVRIDEMSRTRSGRPGFNEQFVAMCKAVIAAQTVVPSAGVALSDEVRTLLLGLYEASMNGSREVTNERLAVITRLLGIEAFGCAAEVQCTSWCGIEGRCAVSFKTGGVPSAIGRINFLPRGWSLTRRDEGIVVAHKDEGSYFATEDKNNIASCILFYLADDLMDPALWANRNSPDSRSANG